MDPSGNFFVVGICCYNTEIYGGEVKLIIDSKPLRGPKKKDAFPPSASPKKKTRLAKGYVVYCGNHPDSVGHTQKEFKTMKVALKWQENHKCDNVQCRADLDIDEKREEDPDCTIM
jgi:hypothetical protein